MSLPTETLPYSTTPRLPRLTHPPGSTSPRVVGVDKTKGFVVYVKWFQNNKKEDFSYLRSKGTPYL